MARVKSKPEAGAAGNPIVIRRARLGQFAGYAGGGMLLLALVGWLWTGSFGGVSVIGLIGAALGFGAWYALAPADFTGFFTGRQVRFGAAATFSALLLIGIVVLAYGIIWRANITLDMTQNQRFSLSAETLRLLERVDRPMQITGFYSPGALPDREIDDLVFRQYPTATDGLIRVVYIDPDEDPVTAQTFRVSEDAQVFLSFLNADGSVDTGSIARIPRGDNYEREVTNAIARALVAGTITVYFETSMGGRDPLDPSLEGMSGVNAGIQESGLITQPLNLAALAETGGDIPADAGAVIFARPVRDLTPDEIAVVQRYLDRGGALLLLADAVFTDAPFMAEAGAFNAALWERYGIRARDQVVVDPAASGQTALDVVSAFVFTENDIGARLDPADGTPTIFRIARAVEADIERPIANIANGQVILSSDQSYGETDLTALAETNTYAYDDGVDPRGPLATVVWAFDQETGARIVLVGDSDFVSNGQVLDGGNAILFTDAVAWLTRLNEEITFAPQAFTTGLPLIFVDQATLNLIALVTIVIIPGVVVGIGVLQWARRSRR